ncbi:hypothetical protein GcM1_185017, partial [Golovinomyces cichoracearum]
DLSTFKTQYSETIFDPKNVEQKSRKATTDYILNAIDSYRELGRRNDNLQEVFREDFEGWAA